jgi:hypothetical protein
MRRHWLLPGMGTRNMRKTQRGLCERSQAPQASKRVSFESRNSSWARVASNIEVPWLKGRGRAACLNLTRTPWRIQLRTWPLAPMRSHSRHLRRTRCRMKGDDGEQESARRATPSFLRWGSRGVALLSGRGCARCRCCCYCFASVGGCFLGSGVRAWRFVWSDVGERRACNGLVGGV